MKSRDIENLIERVIFASRWFQAPLYIGLIVVLGALAVKFFRELYALTSLAWHAEESDLILHVLTLVDVVMVANLVVMVIISGYENFVSRIELGEATEKLSWFGKLDAGSIKIKLASSIVAISAIHLLKAFLNTEHVPNDKLMLLIGIHLTFVISALMLAFMDKMSYGGKSESAGKP
jgi:uncharacterized protein (TIGR00645 family)